MTRHRGGGRKLAPGEARLWQAVATRVRPLTGSTAAIPKPGAGEVSAETPLPTPHRHLPKSLTPKLDQAASDQRDGSVLSAGDPRESRKVARGRREIDATLDLHGITQDEAASRLRHFVDFAVARGARTLLVITGKGGAAQKAAPFGPAPRGILRKRFLEWVEQEPLKSRIAAVYPAHQRHGGRGAFYVLLKKT